MGVVDKYVRGDFNFKKFQKDKMKSIKRSGQWTRIVLEIHDQGYILKVNNWVNIK